MTEITRLSVVPGMRRETLELIKALKDGPIGATLTDAALESHCGKSVSPNEPGYSYLQSAIRYVRRHHGLYWKRIPKTGTLKCLNASECLDEMRGQRQRVHRQTGRMIQTARIADSGNLSDAERTSLRAYTAQAAVLHQMSSTNSAKAIEANGTTESKVNMAKLLESLK